MAMPEAAKSEIVIALNRFSGVRNGGLSVRHRNEDLVKVGAVFDHAPDDFIIDFIRWLLGLAKEDLDKAAKSELVEFYL